MPGAEKHRDPIDAILARAMRSSGAPQRPDCPDPQALAAWFDKSMGAGATARVESHIEECPRCQGLVAAMARAETAAAPETANRPGWRMLFEMRFLAPVVAGVFAIVTLATVFHRRFGRYQNAEQVAALQAPRAAAKAAAETQMLAKNEAAPPRLLTELQSETMPAPRAPARERTQVPAIGAPAAVPHRFAAGASGSAPPAGAAGAAGVAGAPAASMAAPSPLHAFQSGAQLKGQAAEVVAAPATQSPVAVKSPDGTATWHVGPSGFISIVAIEGGHFLVERQDSGVKADLLGGSAVSAKICWAVGRGGTILRTTDGGYHWISVDSPTHADLAAVTARSADSATIRTALGQKFSTTDAGKTWNPD
jgi:hypothetical protein